MFVIFVIAPSMTGKGCTTILRRECSPVCDELGGVHLCLKMFAPKDASEKWDMGFTDGGIVHS